MSLLDADVRWRAVRALQTLLALVAVAAVVTTEFALFVNAALSLGVASLPSALRRRSDHAPGGALALWIAGAAFLHTVGALGPYEMVPGYDVLTHTLSASLVAGAGYAVVHALDAGSNDLSFPPAFRFAFILLFVLAFGVFWEILEFAAHGVAAVAGAESVLTQYGLRDTVLDLVFDAVGAVITALWGTGHFEPVARLFRSVGARAE